MAAVPITINGIQTDENGSRNVTIVGMASLTGVGVGGGPILGGEPPSIWPSPGHPAHPIAPPVGIWPSPGHPAHPIELPPIVPGGPPVSIWPGVPSHPIVLPPPPTEGLEPGGGKPPPADGGWGYHPVFGWGYFPGPGQAGPKA